MVAGVSSPGSVAGWIRPSIDAFGMSDRLALTDVRHDLTGRDVIPWRASVSSV
jgi:hypothetical protein